MTTFSGFNETPDLIGQHLKVLMSFGKANRTPDLYLHMTSARKQKSRYHLSQPLSTVISLRYERSLSSRQSTSQGTTRGSVGFSLLELLDDGFSRWLKWSRNFRFTALVQLSTTD